MNMRNNSARPMGRGVPHRPPEMPCSGDPIVAGGAAEAMGGCCGEEVREADYQTAEHHHGQCSRPCPPSVPFCETMTLHESFDVSGICEENTRICYDTRFLGYTVEELSMKASLPCGGYCMVPVRRVTLTGAIPYLISIGPVRAGCGDPVNLCIQGSTMVDEVVGFICSDEEPELELIGCNNVSPCIGVTAEPCGCSNKSNVTVCGKFMLHNLPSL